MTRPAFAPACALAALALLAAGPAAAADVGGTWTFHGKVSAFSFDIHCRFEQQGERLTGACTDGRTNQPQVATGKTRALTGGSVKGDKVTWTYRSSFLGKDFGVTYAGVLKDSRITGTVTARGSSGPFSGGKS